MRHNTLSKSPKTSRSLGWRLLVGAIATVWMVGTGYSSTLAFSYGPMVALESEAGTLSGGTTVVSDGAASGGQAVQFNAQAPASDWPNASNTGYEPGTTFTTWNVGVNGEDIPDSNFNFIGYEFPAGTRGWYGFNGNNLVFRDCKFDQGATFYGDNITVENCEFFGGGISFSGTINGLAQFNNIHDFEDDAIAVAGDTGMTDDIVIQHNFIHSATPIEDAHANAIHIRGTAGLTVYNNFLDIGAWYDVPLNSGKFPKDSAVFIHNYDGGNSNVTINQNYVNGGRHTMVIDTQSNGVITNNEFGPDYGESGGYVLNNASPGDLVNKTGNYEEGTNTPITF